MDDYPPEYRLHDLPLVVLSGLATPAEQLHLNGHDAPTPVQNVLPGRATTTVGGELPPATGERAALLLSEFLGADGSAAPWNARGLNRRGSLLRFRMRTVGREFKFPPKKADAPAQSLTTPPASPAIAPAYVLHSPISPLSPQSSIFPDGLLAPEWLAKHQRYVPAVFVSFFAFGHDTTRNTLNDNQLKADIARIKAQIQRSECRTRYAVVLVADDALDEAPAQDTEERLANLRRATGLDPKTSLFLLPPKTSLPELRAFAVSVLSTLQPVCTEYYRDLTKHARRKKGRGSPPPPTAPPTRVVSHPLTQAGWNVRYDFKLAVFAEFRQEMDAAQRHYHTALDALFGSDGIFETTASWSPRWDEMRLLADSIALRLIRCQLWNMYPTSAVRSWQAYRNRMRDLLDRRGKGSSNYGWVAWESRWAEIMAQLIQRADLPVFKVASPISADHLSNRVNPIFSLPDKQVSIGERLPPWELLHHAGYWYKLSAEHAKRRFILARDIPEEDRVPPGRSPASKMYKNTQTYDHYLVTQPHEEMPLPGEGPGFEHWRDISAKFSDAVPEFESRGQLRKVEQIQLEICRTLLYAKRYDDAFLILRPLWQTMSWRRDGWWDIASEVVWALHECALRVQDPETYVLTEWELYSPVFAEKSRYRHHLMKCLDEFPHISESNKPSVSINAKDFLSCLSVTFTFPDGEGNVGETLHAQIAVTSNARQGSAPITLSTLTFRFKGCLSEIQIAHEAGESTDGSDAVFSDIKLEEVIAAPQKPRWSGSSNLTIQPGQTRVYDFPITFREAGEVDAVASVFEIKADRFDLVCTHMDLDGETQERPTWWLNAGSKLKPRMLKRGSGASVKVLPKPPKMEIHLPDAREQYYTDEPINIAIEVLNMEEEDTEAVLEVRLLGRSKDALGFSWVGREASSPMKEIPPPLDESSNVDLPGHVVGQLSRGQSITERICFTAPSEPADYVLEVKVLYHLLSDRDIPVSKTIFCDVVFNTPFEASYDLIPRMHPDPWPTFFQVPTADSQVSSGITQKWHLRAKIASFAEDVLIVKHVAIETHAIHGSATCTITKAFDSTDLALNPQELTKRLFSIDCQKTSLEERRTTGLDLGLNITWHRAGPESPNPTLITTSLTIPRITIPSGEPRVLAIASRVPAVPSLVNVDYVLENPTMHFLTFELNMEPSEEFGFSGPKLRSINLLPMSRHKVRFGLYPVVDPLADTLMVEQKAKSTKKSGTWIEPVLKVTDTYFNQTLKVVAADGVADRKKGVAIWVPGDGAEDQAFREGDGEE